MRSFSSEVEDFYAGWSGGLCAFGVKCNDTGDENFIIIIISVFAIHDFRVLALSTILRFQLRLRLDVCRCVLLSAHAADELTSLFWCEIVRVLIFNWEQWAALDDALNL